MKTLKEKTRCVECGSIGDMPLSCEFDSEMLFVEDVKEFIDDILELLNYEVDEREKYLYDTIKQKVGFY